MIAYLVYHVEANSVPVLPGHSLLVAICSTCRDVAVKIITREVMDELMLVAVARVNE